MSVSVASWTHPLDAALAAVTPLRTLSGDAPAAPSRTGPTGRIGIFGGTFDPIHLGHLILAQEAWFQLQLDRVYLVPAGDPPHKQGRQLTSVAERIEMALLATADNDYLRVSRIDADRPSPHYSADMMRIIRRRLDRQAATAQVELCFLMGLDSLRDLPSWHQSGWLVQHCKLVALSRHDVHLDWTALEQALPGVRQQVIILEMPELEISSRNLQHRFRTGQPVRYLIPQAVEQFVRAAGLYTQPA